MVVNTGIDSPAKTWTEPQLTILTRNNPAEIVLAVCKGLPQRADTSANHDRGCQYDECNEACQQSSDS